MKKGKLTNVTTDEAGNIAVILGAKKTLYRNTPLLNISQIHEVADEYERNDCDSLIFDTGAIFDELAYSLASDAVDLILERTRYVVGRRPVVVIFNAPQYKP